MKENYILIVDDQEINRMVLKEEFQKHYQILEAENGAQAISLLKEREDNVCLVLLDLVMPKSDGFQVLDYMEKNGSAAKIPVFVLTADDSPETFKRVEGYLIADMVTKPFMPKIVMRRAYHAIRLYDAKRAENQNLMNQIEQLANENEELKLKVKEYEKRMKNITKQLGLG